MRQRKITREILSLFYFSLIRNNPPPDFHNKLNNMLNPIGFQIKHIQNNEMNTKDVFKFPLNIFYQAVVPFMPNC